MFLKPAFSTGIYFDDSGYLCIEQDGSEVRLSPEQTKNLRYFIVGSYFKQQNLWITSYLEVDDK